MSSFCTPTMTLRCSSRRACTAAIPIREANIRSKAVGDPPRCKCPRIVTRVEYSGCASSIIFATAFAPPSIACSCTSTMDEFLDLRRPLPIASSICSMTVARSGIIAASQPPAIAALRVRKPASRPITSTRKTRSWDVAVSRSLSIHSVIVEREVSYPIVASVPHRSLSIVPGIPTTGTLYSCAKRRAPVKVPSPPMTINASICSRSSVS